MEEEPDGSREAQLRNSSSNEPLPGRKEGDEADEAESSSTGCGWRRFRPKILAPFAHVWTFIVLYIVFAFTHAVQGSYPIAVLTTLERRFNLSSVLAGVIVNISVFGYIISIIIFSFFLSKVNKPRLFAVCMLLTSIGAFLYFLPHVVLGTGSEASNAAHAQIFFNNTVLSESGSGAMIQLCGDDARGLERRTEMEMRMCSEKEKQSADEDVSHVVPAVAILSMADFVHGISAASIWTVGLVFIDDHTEPQLSAKLIGLMYTVRLVSPIVSFAMGGYLLTIHTTLKETDLTPKHPQWIGAWWMGFLINAIINFTISIPMSMLPRNLRLIRQSSSSTDSPEKGKTIPEKKKEGQEKESGSGKEKGRENGSVKEMEEELKKKKAKEKDVAEEEKCRKEEEEVDVEQEKREEGEEEEKREEGKMEKKAENTKTSVAPPTASDESSSGPTKPIDPSSIDWKGFPKAIIRLITNPIYVLTVIAICSDWSVLSFMSFMPKYFEVHFQKTASAANLMGGMIPALFAAGASYVGGVLTGKIKGIDGGVAGLCRMNFLVSFISVLLLGPALLLSCPNITHAGLLVNDRLNLTTECNVNCVCSSDGFDPVCGSDGFLYFSPCHAGCTRMVNSTGQPNDHEGPLVRSEECRCVSEVEGRTEDEKGNVGGRDEDGGSGVVFAGFCDDDCASLIPYILTLVAFVVAFSLYNAAATTTLLRCIKEEDKSIALGLETLCICFAIFPAPLLYGRVFDASCILKRTASCTDSEGSCLLYDRHSLRLTFHGLTIGFKSISTILYCVTYFLGKRKLSLLTAEQRVRQTELQTINTNATS